MTNATEAIERLRKLEKKATKKPWTFDPQNKGEASIYNTNNKVCGFWENPQALEGDAAFIAEARNVVPLLLAEYDRLKQQRDSLAGAIKEIRDNHAMPHRQRKGYRRTTDICCEALKEAGIE